MLESHPRLGKHTKLHIDIFNGQQSVRSNRHRLGELTRVLVAVFSNQRITVLSICQDFGRFDLECRHF